MTHDDAHARWQRIEELFDRAADLPPREQLTFVTAACGGDEGLRAEVLRLLARDQSRAPWIAQMVSDVSRLAPPDPGEPAGRRVGAYRIVREVGRGGQAVVFEAVRADDEFQQRVALKVPTRAAYSVEFLHRFRHERQILAQLQHPHIARLLDGGTTDEGLPFFAMEFVEGEPLTRYASDRALPITERLQLFLQACDAVDYAHQNLVIHRDLKPGNILVTTTGSVRLLDFGVAKLIGDAAAATASHTLTGVAPVTPDYCSPEQLRGQPVTTRTDVYALGLVLFELLTGERAQVADTTSPLTLDRSICETPVPVPSARAGAAGQTRAARQLRGDLDTIVLVAAHKDAVRRYASVAALADDIRRHLEGLPIAARQESRAYVLARSGRRHWKALAAAAVLLATLAGGMAATAYQARRAERRFDQVRGIARALMVDVHEAIRDLPASTGAQETVLRTAVEYLDALALEAGGDRRLQRELAEGYTRAGELAYALNRPSLGRVEEARRYFDRARQLIEPLLADDPHDARVAAAAAALYSSTASFVSRTGRLADAAALAERGVAVAVTARERHDGDAALLAALVSAQEVLVARFEGSPAARRELPRYLESAEALVRLRQDDPTALGTVAVAYAQAGKSAADEERSEEAVRAYRRSIELQTRVVQLAEDNDTARRNLMLAWSHLADLLLGPLGNNSYTGAGGPAVAVDPGQREQALDAASHMVEEARRRRERDAGNDAVAFDYAIARGRQAPAFPPRDRRAVAALEEALAVLRDLAPRNAGATEAFEIEFRGSLAERHREAGRLAAAIEQWQQVERIVTAAVAREPNEFYFRRLAIPVLENQAQAFAVAGDPVAARRVARQVLAYADAVGAREAEYANAVGWPPRARDWVAGLYERLGDRRDALALRAGSRHMWQGIAGRADLPVSAREEARQALAVNP